MTFSAELQHEFIDCLHAIHEGTAQAGQSQRVAQLLTQYEQARQLYLDHVGLFVALQWTLRQQPLAIDLPPDAACSADAGEMPGMATRLDDCPLNDTERVALAPRRRGVWRIAAAVGKPVTWSILAAGLLFAAYIALISWGMLDRDLDRDVVATGGTHVENQKLEIRNQKSEIAPVATIRDTSDVQWSDSPGKLEISNQKSEIAANEPLAIDSGLVELELKQGVTLLIEGPADWSIDGNNNATLKRGKLVAKVPQQAIGFTLETPTAKIVDLGTEFGVTADGDGATQVNVLVGRVDVEHQDRSKRETAVRLQAGESARVRAHAAPGNSSIERIPFDAAALEFATAKGAKKPLDCWLEASHKLRADPALVAYYDFEGGGTALRNVLADKLHGQIVTIREKTPWTDGRWYGKGALAFGEKFAQVTIPYEESLRLDVNFSIVVWLRIDAIPPITTQIIGRGHEPARNYAFWLDANSGARFDWNLYTVDGANHTIRSRETAKLDHWHQLVGVVTPGQAVMYLDGRVEGSTPLRAEIAKDDEPLKIGQSTEARFATPFTGVIDELVIYGRALTAEEVEQMYLAGKPAR